MSDPNEVKSARRRRAMIAGTAVLLGVFTTATALYAERAPMDWRLVDYVRTAGFLLLSLVLAIRSTTAFSLIGRNPALDDELTRANRASAARVGFWGMFLTALAVMAIAMFEPVTINVAAPLVIGVGAICAALRFAMLERRGA